MGITIRDSGSDVSIIGGSGHFIPCVDSIYLANSGTSMRLLTGLCMLGKGRYNLSGSKRMHERPIQHLLDSLQQLGVKARSINGNGCPPVEIEGDHITRRRVSVNCRNSSQYLSSLLLAAPCTEIGMESQMPHEPTPMMLGTILKGSREMNMPTK